MQPRRLRALWTGHWLQWLYGLRCRLDLRLRKRLLFSVPAGCRVICAPNADDDGLDRARIDRWAQQGLQGEGQGVLGDRFGLEPLQ